MRLLHPTISRRHATLARTGEGITVEDHDSRFGTFVNGSRVRRTSLRPGDRVQFGSAIAYRVQDDGLRLDVAAEGMGLHAAGLTISVARDLDLGHVLDVLRNDPSRGWTDLTRGERRPLVQDISFGVRPDTFTGILGPSGAGKSTILNALASYLAPDLGRIVFDGQHDLRDEPDAYRAMLGHVPQHNVVFGPLTARENLTFAARLRLGVETPASDIDAAIGQALERVDLAEHADKPVAVLSGGQRKRLSVAIELLRRPRLLLLDEPTSGLDPASEAHLMEQLRQMARRGTTVVCTTHLMDNLRLLDEVIVLGRIDRTGRIAYVGPPADLLPHFRCRGFADLYEMLESGRFEPPASSDEPIAPVREPAEHRGEWVPPGVRPVEPRSDTDTTPAPRRTGVAQLAASLATDPGWSQLGVVARRALRLLLRDRVLMLVILAQPVLLGLLVALTQYDVARNEISRITFFAVVIAIWLGLNNSARDLVNERRHYVRDRLAGLRPRAYLGAKAAVQGAVGVAQILILLSVLRVGCGLVVEREVREALGETPWVGIGAVLWLCHLGGVGLGLLASTLARTEESAVAALPLLILPQLLLSAIATGTQGESYTKPRPFRPLVVTVMRHQELSPPAALIDALSLGCLSRPAALVAESPTVRGYDWPIWVFDLFH
nr:ATP-binding cassette domain-containing protein [Acidimicrobiia bacterium]